MNNNIFEIISECCYPINTRDIIATSISELFNLEKSCIFYKVVVKEEKIIVAHLKLNIHFKSSYYDVPLLIYFPKQFPKHPPDVYIEKQSNTAINPKNIDIDAKTKKVNLNSLKTWNVYSTLIGILDEAKASFSKEFPIFKIANNQNDKTLQQNSQNNQSNQLMSFETNKIMTDYYLTQVKDSTQNKIINQSSHENEIKKKLVSILKTSLEFKIKEEIIHFKKQEEILNNYKKEFNNFNDMLSNFTQNKNKAINMLTNYTISINNEILNFRENLNKLKFNTLTQDNYKSFISYTGQDLIYACCMEATLEDFMSIIKKSLEKRIFSFEDSIKLIRETSKEIIRLRFYKVKLSKYHSNKSN